MDSQGSLVLLTLVCLCHWIWASPEVDLSGPLPKARHFKFKRRKVNGRDVAVVTFRLDPERGRRSVLVPKEEQRFIHTPSLLHYKPSFESEYEGINRSSPRRKSHPRLSQSGEDEREGNLLKAIRIKEEFENEVRKENELLNELESSIDHELRRTHSSLPLDEERRPKNRKPGSHRDFPSRSRARKSRKRNRVRERRKRKKMRKKKLKKSRRKKKKGKVNKGVWLNKDDACKYKTLKKCARKAGVLPVKPNYINNLDICKQRKIFLNCVEKRQSRFHCPNSASSKGNLSRLRSRIRNFFSASLCLLKESLK